MKELGIPEMSGKIGICMENRTYLGTSFFIIQGHNEVGMCVCVVQMKFKDVTWKYREGLCDVI